MAAKNQMDLTRGPLFRETVVFTLPLVLSGLLQLGFHAADMIVIGRYASADSLAAVGATGALCVLLVAVFCGLAVGANVVVANFYGARDHRGLSRAVHTSVLISLAGGAAVMLAGAAASRPLLQAMGVPPAILGKSSLYMWLYCLGIPATFLYNFGSAILRAVGDTRNPLLYLAVSGFVNVLLNLFLVVVVRLDVAGVAAATVLSQSLAAFLVLRNLAGPRSVCRLRRKLLRLDPRIVRSLVRIGVPAGVQSSLYCIANMTIQSGVNSFGPVGIAGNAAAASLEGFIAVATSAYYQSVTTFVGQNYGAGQFGRIVKSILYCLGSGVALNLVLGAFVFVFTPQLIGVYNSDPEVIAFGVSRMRLLVFTYALCTLMDVITGALRGLGHSLRPAVVTLLGACLLRILWVLFVFPLHRTLPFLLLCFPISWLVVAVINGFFLVGLLRAQNGALPRVPQGAGAVG